MKDYIIVRNDKVVGFDTDRESAKRKAKMWAKQTGSGHRVYSGLGTFIGGTGRYV